MSYTAAVLTISDLGSRGPRQGTSGPAVAALRDCADTRHIDLIVTTGGTGLSPRDVTPEATLDVLDREIRAIPVAMWVEGLKITPRAMLLSSAVLGEGFLVSAAEV